MTNILTAEEAKQAGNVCFQSKDFKSAIQNYDNALKLGSSSSTPEFLAICHNNRATSNYCLGNFNQSLIDVEYSLQYKPKYIKAHLRKIEALLRLNEVEKAHQAYTSFISTCGIENETKEVKELSQRINAKLEEHRNEMHQEAILDFMKGGEQSFGNPMFQMMQMYQKIGMVGESPNIPSFHLEYKKKFPSETQHYQALESLYHDAKSENMRILELSTQAFREMTINSFSYIGKRFGFPLDEGLKNKIYRMQPGEIIVEADRIKKQKLAYPKTFLFHSFSNCSQRKIVLNYGKNYVSLGFVDLSFIRNNLVKAYENEYGPINIFLYDSCPFVCAKSKILLIMLKDQSISVESIFQVWYSSGWSYQTEKDFIKTCIYYLNSFEERDPDTKSIIKGWIEAPQLDIKKIRNEWFDSMNPLKEDCYNPLYENDRVEISRYFLTGELLACDVGSRCMFVIPLKGYKRWREENFLNSQDLRVIPDNKKSFLSSVIDHVLKEIQITKNTFEQNKGLLNVHIIRKEITPQSKEILNELKKINAWVIVWSNLCDYYPKEDFMYMVRNVSESDTMHAGHSMNWTQMVFGTELSDYSIEGTQKLIKSINQFDIKSFYSTVGGIILRLNPEFHTNLRNKGEWFLAQGHKKNWTKYYLENNNHAIVDEAFPFGYEHKNTTFFFQFSLDPLMVFNY